MKTSYSYSSETHGFKDKIKFLSISPLQSVDVYPGTITEGFLLFEKKYKNECPQKLFFKNIKEHIAVDVVLDKKVKKTMTYRDRDAHHWTAKGEILNCE